MLKTYLVFLLAFSGLKVNFAKSKLFGIGVSQMEIDNFASILGCQASSFPCTYLGLPLGSDMCTSLPWDPIIEKFQNKLTSWKSKSLSFGGRLTLVKSVLGSLGSYYLSLLKAPKKVINKLEGLRRNFFWGGFMKDRKIAWKKCLLPKKNGGLGIGSLQASNYSLLLKWWWRFKVEPNSLWCKVIKSIHGVYGSFRNTSNSLCSGIWNQISNLDNLLLKDGIDLHSFFKKKIGNGMSTSFWKDNWLGGIKLKDEFPRLYALESFKDCKVRERFIHMDSLMPTGPYSKIANTIRTVEHSHLPQVASRSAHPSVLLSELLGSFRLSWDWRRPVHDGHEHNQLSDVEELLSNMTFNNESDLRICTIDPSRIFSVAAIRNLITESSIGSVILGDQAEDTNFDLIKSWRIKNERLPTQINLDRGIDLDSTRCPLCDKEQETEHHLFLVFRVARVVWQRIFSW